MLLVYSRSPRHSCAGLVHVFIMLSLFFYRLTSKIKFFLTSPRLVVFSFALLIFLGAIALRLPISIETDAEPTSVLEALFTSASAVCVTGLSIRSTGHDYSAMGQFVILLLIQLGGLGIITFSNFILAAQRGKVGLSGRMMINETHGILPGFSPARILKSIFFFTALFELLGFFILSWRFSITYPLPQALWLGLFHSVSAFCNAGFSLFDSSLMRYQGDVWMNATFMVLIVAGGLGPIVLADISSFCTKFGRQRRLTFHTKVVLSSTVFLILLGGGVISLLEIGGHALPNSPGSHLLSGFFLAISARTAGFNSVETAQLTNATLLIVILLMTIGGSPGSMAGGIKTTTFTSLLVFMNSRTRNRPGAEIFQRTIRPEIVVKAMLTLAGFTVAVIGAVVLLQFTELAGMPHAAHRGAFLEHLFEVVSALGTTGLSTGITSGISSAGKMVLISCMFLGRLGPLMLAASVVGSHRQLHYKYPEDNLIIG